MTAVLDDTLLGDPAALASADSAGMLRAAATAGALVRSTAHAAAEAGLAELAGHRPRALVCLRRPGSSGSAAELLTALLGPRCPVPVVHSDVVPAWIGPLDVVLAHTADAADVELAESVSLAVARGAEVVLSAPAEGPVASAGAGRARFVEPRIPVPAALDLPRALAVGLSLASALGLWTSGQDGPVPALDALADALDAEAERNQPGHEPFMNPAKSLALRLAEHTPLLWGTDAVAAAVAGHGATALATHAGMVAQAGDIAQAATATALRRAVDLAQREDDIFRDPFDAGDDGFGGPDAPPVRVVLLATGEEDPGQVAVRRSGRGWPADIAHPVDEVPRGTRDAPLLRAALLASRLDAAAIYLGLATRTIEPA